MFGLKPSSKIIGTKPDIEFQASQSMINRVTALTPQSLQMCKIYPEPKPLKHCLGVDVPRGNGFLSHNCALLRCLAIRLSRITNMVALNMKKTIQHRITFVDSLRINYTIHCIIITMYNTLYIIEHLKQ